VRHRVGVNSTTIVRAGVTPAARPNPTRNRKIANTTQAPVGTNPINPALIPQMKVPMTVCILRPKRSPRAPNTREPMIAPTPAA
jgi:hypothetical protein